MHSPLQPAIQRPTRPLITISIPVFNEEGNIANLMERLRKTSAQVADRYDFEFLFTDNDSQDGTLALLEAEVARDARVRVLKFSRNFGFQRSILTNFLHARGAAAIQIDADLQDPPEMILDFLAHWEKGYKVVYGVRTHRTEGALLLFARKLFYRLIDRITEFPVPVDAGDFRLIDRLIIDQLRTVTDRNPYLRGLIASFGYPSVGIPYARSVRTQGTSKFNFIKLLTLGMDGVTSQSTKPLQFIALGGFALCGLSVLVGLGYGLLWLAGLGQDSPGFTTLVIIQLFALGINAAVVGVIGEYIGRVFDNVRGHPMSIVERTIESAPSAGAPSIIQLKSETVTSSFIDSTHGSFGATNGDERT
jgi:glycosyltransferase involved in cell wall biosynthesis